MATKTIKLDKQTAKKITNGIKKPFKKTKSLFTRLGVIIDRDTIMTFKGEGARKGSPGKWKKFSKKTLKTPRGTWKIRYGTDKRPKRNAAELADYKSEHNLWYVPGPMKGYRSDRRYGANSKLLQASGSFRNSFRILQTSKNRMLYGTRHKLADKIMSNPTRNVLQYTNQDKKRYGSLISNWISRGIKF